MKNLIIKLVDTDSFEICIKDKRGDHIESQQLPIDCWSLEDYQKQWKEGLERIKAHNESMLVIWVNKLNKNPDIAYFALYKIGKKIHIQECGIIGKKDYKDLSKEYGPFNVENCYKYIPMPYEPLDEGDSELTDYVLEYVIDIE